MSNLQDLEERVAALEELVSSQQEVLARLSELANKKLETDGNLKKVSREKFVEMMGSGDSALVIAHKCNMTTQAVYKRIKKINSERKG